MARILNVHPGSGEVEDTITIKLEYDEAPDGGTPNVAHVVFHDGASADTFNVVAHDAAKRELTIDAIVPTGAATGPIEVDLDGYPPIATVQNFTVTRPQAMPLRIEGIMPVNPNGYAAGSVMTLALEPISIAETELQRAQVLFPRVVNGPANLRPTVPLAVTAWPPRLRVTVPKGAASGRVKVHVGADSAFTRSLIFI